MSKQFHTIDTIPVLQENVVAIWSINTKEPHPITPDLLIPDGYIELFFVLSGSYKKRKLSGKDTTPFIVNQSSIKGIQDKVIMSQNIEDLKCIGVQIDPMRFYHLFGDMGVTATNEHLPISESSHEELIKLNEKVAKKASITEALQEIEKFFTNYNPKIVECETWQLTKNCLQELRNTKGNTTIESIAKLGETSVDTLNSHFKKFIGLTAEEMKNIITAASSYKEPPIQVSKPSLSVKNLFKDITKNKEDST